MAITIVLLAGLGLVGAGGASDRAVPSSALEAGPDAALSCILGPRAKSSGMCAWNRGTKTAGESEKSAPAAPLPLAKGMPASP